MQDHMAGKTVMKNILVNSTPKDNDVGINHYALLLAAIITKLYHQGRIEIDNNCTL